MTSQVVTVVFGPAVWRLIDSYDRQLRNERFHSRPNPDRDVFCSRILESAHFVQALMIKLTQQGRKRPLNIGKIHHEAGRRFDRSIEPKLDSIRMPMHPMA